MATLLLLLSVLVPLAFTLALALERGRASALTLAAWAPFPALAAALAVAPGTRLDLPFVLLGVTLGLDDHQRVILLFTAILWTVAGFYARAYHRDDQKRVWMAAFWLVTMAGNFGLIVAQDVASFYFAFVAMNLAAFGLIVHTRSREALRAARVYLVLVIVGEALILPGLWVLSHAAGSRELSAMAQAAADPATSGWILACIALGFGIKAGTLPLHVWLPLAHPAAPTPASAILSGALIKAGLLAWMQFLPLPAPAQTLGAVFAFAGIAGAFFGVVCGLGQTKSKTLLAYSSISQMGLIMIAVGTALSVQGAQGAAVAAILVYAFHHAVAKGALFLGVGVVEHTGPARRKRHALLLLVLPAAALAGAPLTSGHLAKSALKAAMEEAAPWWYGLMDILMALAAVGTTLLMLRFLLVMARAGSEAHGEETDTSRGLWPAWLSLLVVVAIVPWTPLAAPPELAFAAFEAANLWTAGWPVLLGLAIGILAWRLSPAQTQRPLWSIPEGDVLVPAVRLGATALSYWRRLAARLPEVWPAAGPASRFSLDDNPRIARLRPRLDGAEVAMRRWLLAGLLLLIVVALVAVLSVT